MALSLTATIGLETYSWAIGALNLGEAHVTLVGGHKWYPADRAAARDSRVKTELRQAGFMDRDDQFTNLGEDVFAVMQRAEVEYYTYADVDEAEVSIRTAALGSDALLVIAADESIDIEGIPRDELGSRLVRALPDRPAARVHSCSADVEVLKRLAKGERLMGGNSIADAKRLNDWLNQQHDAAGEMHVAVRHTYGGKRIKNPSPEPLWFDSPDGRGLVHARNGWVTLKGVNAIEMAAKFGELERELTDSR